MLCPIDKTELRITEREKVEIDYCPTCRGVWLDRGELDKVIERFAAERRPARAVQGLLPDGSLRYGPSVHQSDDERRRYADQRGYRRDDDDDDDDDRYRGRKRRGWLGDMFDF